MTAPFTSFDVDLLRTQFPALDGRTAFFDSPGGTQTPRPVGEAIASAITSPLANRGFVTQAERNATRIGLECREALGDLLNVDADTVMFGRSATALAFDLSRSISREWKPGDEVVVTRLDHNSNVQPWLLAAERTGAVVKWAEFDPATGELPVEAITQHLSARTRLVAVTAASNVIGTMPDIAAIAGAVHDAGALLYVDGVHYTAHAVVDVQALGADFFSCSPYKFLGPHCAAVTGRRHLLENLVPDKLSVSPPQVPERFELGTLPYELMAGTTAAIDFLSQIAPEGTTRRERLAASLHAVDRHELSLRQAIETGLSQFDQITVHSGAARRTPTLFLSVEDRREGELSEFLAAHDINAPASHFYAVSACEALGLGPGGALRIGLAPYNSTEDVDRLLDALRAYFS